MKKFKLNTISAIAVYAMLTLVASSCKETTYPETPSKFVVERIQLNKTKGTCIYLVAPIETKDLTINKTWIVDSVGKFDVGDTLSFQHYH